MEEKNNEQVVELSEETAEELTQEEKKEEICFQKLTPINNVNMGIYNDALDYVFQNNDVRNVGISGSYSAGKSSVIGTYEDNHTDISFMHISLAHFENGNEKNDEQIGESCNKKGDNGNNANKNSNKDTNKKANNKYVRENILEGKILNQLVHQIDAKDIPQTGFRIKREISDESIVKVTRYISAFVILILYIVNRNNIMTLVDSISSTEIEDILMVVIGPEATLCAICAAAYIFSYLLYKAICLQMNKHIFKGITVQGNKVEIFEQSDESYFDKYLNEVLYLFEHANKNVIVFEDIDRFDSNQIFQRLREINTLLNNRRKSDETIRFFYLIRDDIFENKDRTKFFDFILPIVPVLDGSNAYDQMIIHLKKGGMYDQLSNQFLQDVSLYIDDMRVLKNIFNEFVVYTKKISTTEQNPDKLFAMIIYKNIFPYDFSQLQLNRGYIYLLFSNKDTFIENEIKKLQEEKKEIENKIDRANNEHLRNIEEINVIYNPQNNRLMNRYYNTNENINALQNEKNKRIENIENRKDENMKILELKISELDKCIDEMKEMTLSGIIAKENIKDFFMVSYVDEVGYENDFHEIKQSSYFSLIKYLIRNEYIDDSYSDYMTFFYEESISRRDKIFLRSIADEEAKAYDYKLVSPSKVLCKLSYRSFKKKAILNFDLIDYLLECSDKYEDMKMELYLQLMLNKNLDFVSQYMRKGVNIYQFIAGINLIWTNIFGYILSEYGLDYIQKNEYAYVTLVTSDDETLKLIDKEQELSSFIEQEEDFLRYVEAGKISVVINAFKILNIKFKYINYHPSVDEIFKTVYKNNMYDLNFNMITFLLEKIYGFNYNEEKIKHKNYSLIRSKVNEPLLSYVNENINDYISTVLENCNKKIQDVEEVVCSVLNNKNVDVINKISYIKQMDTVIESIEKITDYSIWEHLLSEHKVKGTERNVLNYFSLSLEMDDILIQFINTEIKEFSMDSELINEEFEEECGDKFVSQITYCMQLKDDIYKKMHLAFGFRYSDLPIENIEPSKLKILICNDIVAMNSNILKRLRKYNSDEIITCYILQNFDEYIENVFKEEKDYGDVCKVLDSELEDRNKIQLIEMNKEIFSVQGRTISETVMQYILENNFDENDLQYIFSNYLNYGNLLQNAIKSKLLEYIENIFSGSYMVPLQLCNIVFENEKFSLEQKMKLFADNVGNSLLFECINSLKILDEKKLLSALYGKRPAIDVTPLNKKILEVFDEKDWISRYDIDKKDINMYRVIGKQNNILMHKNLILA